MNAFYSLSLISKSLTIGIVTDIRINQLIIMQLIITFAFATNLQLKPR